MIRIALFLVIGVLVSCNTPKPVVEEQPKTETVPQTNKHDDEVFYLGEVQILDCGAVIRIYSGETNYQYSPMVLDLKFRIDQQRLKLKFKVLDRNAPECSEFKAIEITEVFAVR
jgi:hypothetical protein